jgi:2-oxoglutarate ferredoxin oxidoreductase subunit alpha
MTPVVILSDGYIANGAGPWKFPQASDLPKITPPLVSGEAENFKPYKRDGKGVRPWAIPGQKGWEHRLGGLEKENETGNVSYDPENHDLMVSLRAQKIEDIANDIPLAEIDSGVESGKVLVLGWGSTYGAIKTAVKNLREEGVEVGHLHLRHIHPMPKNVGEILSRYDAVIVPEFNKGQLVKVIREKYLVDAQPLSKVQGLPFLASEISAAVKAQVQQLTENNA